MNDFGLKIRIFDISKIKKKLKKLFLLETVHVTLKYHLLKNILTLRYLDKRRYSAEN